MWRLSCNWHCKNRIYLRCLLWKVGTVPNISMTTVVDGSFGAKNKCKCPSFSLSFDKEHVFHTNICNRYMGKKSKAQVFFLLDITYQLWKSHVKIALLSSKAASGSWESTGSAYRRFPK